jgi:hypothetical protein
VSVSNTIILRRTIDLALFLESVGLCLKRQVRAFAQGFVSKSIIGSTCLFRHKVIAATQAKKFSKKERINYDQTTFWYFHHC